MRNPPELLGIQWLRGWVILRQLNCARQFPQLATLPKVSSLQLHAAHRFEFELLPAGKPGSQPTGQRSYSARVPRGSSASRSPSPTKLTLNTVIKTNKPGNTHSQGALSKYR